MEKILHHKSQRILPRHVKKIGLVPMALVDELARQPEVLMTGALIGAVFT